MIDMDRYDSARATNPAEAESDGKERGPDESSAYIGEFRGDVAGGRCTTDSGLEYLKKTRKSRLIIAAELN